MDPAIEDQAFALTHPEPEEDRQESMFEDAASFPGGEEVDASPESSYETADGLPQEAPDEDVFVPEAAAGQPEVEPEAEAEPEPLTVLTIDDFAALEERVLRAVSLVRREREARIVAEERLLILESQVLAQSPALEQLQQEVEDLRAEREQVRQRVERLLGQLDALEL